MRVTDLDGRSNSASVENGPADSGADGPKPAAAREPIARADALQTGDTRQGKSWEQICHGRADLRRCGSQLPLGAANIRTPSEKIGGQTDTTLRRRGGDH